MPVLLLTLLCLLTAGCDTPKPEVVSTNTTLILWNWPNYMTEDVLRDFTQETGIRVDQRIFGDEEILLGAMQGLDFNADLLIISESLGRELIQARLVAPLDPELLPNLSHIDQDSLALCSQQGQLYSAPYLAGTTGVAINIKHVPENSDSWNILWNEDLRGHVAMLSNNFEVVAAASMKLGFGIVPTTAEQFTAVEEELVRQRPLLKGYLPVDEITDGLVGGELWAAHIYSGDALGAAELNPDLRYFVPREGAVRWLDMIMVSRPSIHLKEAHAFINYLHRPEVMARLSEDLHSATPNAAARALVSKAILADPQIYPSSEILARCAFFPVLDPNGTSAQRTSELWNALTAP